MASNDISSAVADEVRRLIAAGAPESADTIQQAISNVAKGRGGIFSTITNLISGFPADVMRNIKFAVLAALIGTEAENLIQRAVTERRLDLDPVPSWLEPLLSSAMIGAEEAIGAPIFDLLVNDPLGLGLSAQGSPAEAAAVRMTQRLFGLGAGVDFGVAQLEDILSAVMGGNAPKGLTKAVGNIPWAVGANWATGFFLSNIFNAAAMPAITDKINAQYRPTRMSEANLLALVRLGRLQPSDVYAELASLGYSDERITQLFWLDKSPISMADLQAGYVANILSEDEIRAKMKALGYEDADQDLMWNLYIVKAETAGADYLRAVAQAEYRDNHITETEYRDYLAQANVPQRSIDLEVFAANLAKQVSRKALAVGDIKAGVNDGLLSDAEALVKLTALGYSEDDAGLLIREWHTVKATVPRGLSESQIISYLKSGVLTPPEAFTRLVALGLRAEDATFIVANTHAVGVTSKHPLTVATIMAAYKDGVIDQPTAEAKLASIGTDADEARLLIQSANVKLNRGPKPKVVKKELSEAQVIEALHVGLAAPTWAIRELVTIGYTDADARLLVEIELTKESGIVDAAWTVLT